MDTPFSLEMLHKIAGTHSEPLFLSPPWMSGGHTIEKANGTITYISYRGGLYGVTCAHIYDYQFSSNPPKWLTVHGLQRVIYQFGFFDQSGYKSLFRSLRLSDPSLPDIAIVRLDAAFASINMEAKGKIAIDLDSWIEPTWADLKCPVAFGYPTEHKTESEGLVQAPLISVTAELTRPIGPNDVSFLMASSLEQENSYYFSGMSGGAVYCHFADAPPSVVGVVFEGSPGSSIEWQNRTEESFYTREDIQIRAHKLTPDIFQSWLSIAGF
ncbi:hypothetical protein GCM10007860_30970 [Chitiniphilus shinanonensis]|uniref:Uncharacterized protein n=1 Tax=Chitiniphilus shinanonensis TaxID=553088 RepID=A0ABQ6BVB2_9NEIS|nr:hypothetical protein [Chitiniphilus shinanonensis]GLS05933.1 hypothetical protein GCM10007860_30970 [Chitiniphilus shinanonensis]